MNKFLNIDYLKSLGKEPKFFGLGFIQIKLDDYNRLHFWHPEINSIMPEEEVHNHRYNFCSTVLLGTIHHTVYKFTNSSTGDYEKHYVSCDPNTEAPLNFDPGCLTPYNTYILKEGSQYSFQHDEFHIAYADRAMTHVCRGSVIEEYAQVIRPKNTSAICPFSKQIPTNKLWEYIEDLLSVKSGYHTGEIIKGEYGEISKISEELAELIDARRQNSSIMELVELSDLYGAMEAMVEKYHGKTMDDLRIMSDITKRVFKNGYR